MIYPELVKLAAARPDIRIAKFNCNKQNKDLVRGPWRGGRAKRGRESPGLTGDVQRGSPLQNLEGRSQAFLAFLGERVGAHLVRLRSTAPARPPPGVSCQPLAGVRTCARVQGIKLGIKVAPTFHLYRNSVKVRAPQSRSCDGMCARPGHSG